MFKYIAKKEISNEDWKTQLAQKYPNIPKGAEVKIIQRDFRNYYGVWVVVEWNGNRYYTSKDNIEEVYDEKENSKFNVEKIADIIADEAQNKMFYVLASDIIDIYNHKFENYGQYKELCIRHKKMVQERNKNVASGNYDEAFFEDRISLSHTIYIEPILLTETQYNLIYDKGTSEVFKNDIKGN